MQLFVFRNLHHSTYRLAVLAKDENEAKAKMTSYVRARSFVETDFVLDEVAGKLSSEVFSLAR